MENLAPVTVAQLEWVLVRQHPIRKVIETYDNLREAAAPIRARAEQIRAETDQVMAALRAAPTLENFNRALAARRNLIGLHEAVAEAEAGAHRIALEFVETQAHRDLVADLFDQLVDGLSKLPPTASADEAFHRRGKQGRWIVARSEWSRKGSMPVHGLANQSDFSSWIRNIVASPTMPATPAAGLAPAQIFAQAEAAPQVPAPPVPRRHRWRAILASTLNPSPAPQ